MNLKRIAEGIVKQWVAAGRRWAVLITAAALAGAGLAAQSQSDNSGAGTRAIRLSYVQGQVQVSNGAEEITSQAVANMPIFEGYRVTTGHDGQAEIQFEDGSVARIAPDSGVMLKVLRGQGSSGQAEMVLNGGLGYFELQGGDQAGRIEVEFGDAKVTAAGFTMMRIDEDTPPGNLAVFSGNAHLVEGDAVTLDLHGNESVSLNASDPGQYNLAEAIETNSWDQWNSDRDQALQAESTTQNKATDSFVNSDNPAWNDLNSSGNWYDVPGSGFVWSPYMAVNAGWDPYGCGQWMFTPQFGYTWVSCYAWGFMPYSCGMWNFYSSFGWGWSPGMGGGCNPWWGAGFGGYRGPNIGIAPSGYHPVVRPPLVLNRPRGRVPQPILIDREPKHGFGNHTLRSTSGPVTIAGHVVAPLQPMPARTSFVRPAVSTGPAGGAVNRAIVIGSEPRSTVVADRGSQRQGYTSTPAHTPAGEGYRQPNGYAPQAQRGERMPNRAAGGARPSGGNYSDRGSARSGASNSGGGSRGGDGGGGGFGGGSRGGGGGGFQGPASAPAGGGGSARGGGGSGAHR